jgi:hypothetical protein
MAMQKKLSSPLCPRRFSLPAHLARHVNSSHGSPRPKAAARRGRPRKAASPSFAGGPSIPGFEPARLSLTQLCHVIDIAKAEAGRRLQQI